MLPIADAHDVALLLADHHLGERGDVGGRLVDDRLHVGPRGDALVLGDAVRGTGPDDVRALDHQLRHRVADAGVEALDHGDAADDRVRGPVGVSGDHEVDRRVLELLGDAHDRALPRLRRVRRDAVGAELRALVDDHDLDLHAPAPELPRLALDPLRLVEELEAGGGVLTHQLRRRPDHRADDADAYPVDAEDRRSVQPVRPPARVLIDDVRRQEREVRAVLMGEQPLEPEVELVVAEARRVQPPRVLDVDRRHVLQQRRVRR
jgi:hypothetical protein